MNTEISKVVAEMRERRPHDSLPSYGQMQDWLDRIERALQQPASADVEREARELLAVEYERDGRRVVAEGIRAGTLDDFDDVALRAITAALRKPQEIMIHFPQVGIAGPLPLIDGNVTLPDVTMNDLIRHARTGYVTQQEAEPVAKLHSDGYWTHEPGRDPFDRFGPNANRTSMDVYTAPQPRIDSNGGGHD